jgi:hypothetical protein
MLAIECLSFKKNIILSLRVVDMPDISGTGKLQTDRHTCWFSKFGLNDVGYSLFYAILRLNGWLDRGKTVIFFFMNY